MIQLLLSVNFNLNENFKLCWNFIYSILNIIFEFLPNSLVKKNIVVIETILKLYTHYEKIIVNCNKITQKTVI